MHLSFAPQDESKRLTGAEIKAHVWFNGLDWDALFRQELPLLDIQKAEGVKPGLYIRNWIQPNTVYIQPWMKLPVPEETPGPSAADLSKTQQALFDGFFQAFVQLGQRLPPITNNGQP